jgi:hypothetical protein
MVDLVDHHSGRLLLRRVLVCSGFLARCRGYLLRDPLARPDGILLLETPRVHTMFLDHAIDIHFLDGSLRVLAGISAVPPFRFPSGFAGCRNILEVARRPEGEPPAIPPGVRLALSFRVRS